jgi:hypothetical protein
LPAAGGRGLAQRVGLLAGAGLQRRRLRSGAQAACSAVPVQPMSQPSPHLRALMPLALCLRDLSSPTPTPLSAMTKTLDSTAVYAYTTLISMLICVPIALVMEGAGLGAGAQVGGLGGRTSVWARRRRRWQAVRTQRAAEGGARGLCTVLAQQWLWESGESWCAGGGALVRTYTCNGSSSQHATTSFVRTPTTHTHSRDIGVRAHTHPHTHACMHACMHAHRTAQQPTLESR